MGHPLDILVLRGLASFASVIRTTAKLYKNPCGYLKGSVISSALVKAVDPLQFHQVQLGLGGGEAELEKEMLGWPNGVAMTIFSYCMMSGNVEACFILALLSLYGLNLAQSITGDNYILHELIPEMVKVKKTLQSNEVTKELISTTTENTLRAVVKSLLCSTGLASITVSKPPWVLYSITMLPPDLETGPQLEQVLLGDGEGRGVQRLSPEVLVP